jgi:uncharacterized damage-inducible protein DinB
LGEARVPEIDIRAAHPIPGFVCEEGTMEPQVAPLAAILDLNADLLLNCLDDLTDAEAQRRLEAGGNSVTFLASHLTDNRHFLAARLGHPLSNPLAHYLEDVRSIDDIHQWPSLDEVRPAWTAIAGHVQRVLGALSAEELAEADLYRFPMGDRTRLGLIAYLVQHDSYHLGQVGFLRRQLGKPPMSYARGAARRTSPAGAA